MKNITSFKKKILISSIIGNALEFYDFTLVGVFVTLLAKVYFPVQSDFLQLLSGLSVFAAAFLTRPFGALVFGHIGDKYGRKTALTWSVTLMGVPTFIISILPGYDVLGIAAPIILVCCRLLQGLCTGGEYNGAAIFALEHLKNKPGMVSGLISGSCVLGALSAMFMGYLTSESEWAWRIPFAFGALISLVGYFIRVKTLETDEFLQIRPTASSAVPFVKVWKNSRKSFFMAIACGLFNGVLSYTLFGFLAVYLKTWIGFSLSLGLFYNLFGLLAFMTLCPLFGGYSDQISPASAVKLSGKLALILPMVVFWLFQTNDAIAIILGQILLGTIVASFVGPSHYFLQTLFVTENRYTGAALGFTIGMGLTGGTTPLILTTLLEYTNSLYIPAYYMMAHAVLWIFWLNWLYPQIKLYYKTTHDNA